ncbi:uncharacterized protein EKO05_0005746 [Ascochyta rabiei]|uniref:uncharacterized protein n=1 Tax=Didymella rabiei TaxID=5454 RepID=UPI002202A60D|nr:uncharacterized protein EKO05_0005746 [Ascochyta rabiei]UPX15292.1 hypothetical protein EKO05_0005746 [Ascochyta rabiei]
MACSNAGRRKILSKRVNNSNSAVKRCGAASTRTNCPMAFWLAADDGGNLETSVWRVLHMEERKLCIHNHPPVKDRFVFARNRRETRELTNEERVTVVSIIQSSRGAAPALSAIKAAFLGQSWTRQDVRNKYRKALRMKLGIKTKVEQLVLEMDECGWWHQYVQSYDISIVLRI